MIRATGSLNPLKVLRVSAQRCFFTAGAGRGFRALCIPNSTWFALQAEPETKRINVFGIRFSAGHGSFPCVFEKREPDELQAGSAKHRQDEAISSDR
jgi:hypothetical protein